MSSSPKIFQQAYYQRLADIEEKHWWSVGLRSIMAGLIGNRLDTYDSVDVLDVGCGTGYLMQWLRDFTSVGAMVGLDLSAHALRFCQENGERDVQIADASILPYANESFDFVVCIDTLQHLSPIGADQRALEEFARMLRAGGYVFIRTNSALGHPPLKGVDPNQYRRYHRTQMEEMLQRAGLDPIKVTYSNSLPAVWGMIKEYRAGEEPPPSGPTLTIEPPTKQTVITSALRTWLAIEEAYLTQINGIIPFGHSVLALARKPPV